MATVITKNSELTGYFERACNYYNKISFVTAWAGNHSIINNLFENNHKIESSVVGLHFYQTSPEFIKRFLDNTNIQYNKRMSTDVFHPKAYLFYNSDHDWEAIVGSSNLTGGGFGRNVECNVLMTSKEDSNTIYKSIKKLIKKSWSESEPMGDFLEKYIEMYNESRKSIQRLRSPLNQNVTDISWNEYIERLIQNDGEGYDLNTERIQARLTILSIAQDLFSENSLKYFEGQYPLAIAGLIAEYDNVVDWRLFASTRPNGRFFNRFNTYEVMSGISDALDIIPFNGEVTKDQFDEYVAKMRHVTELYDIKTIATRFLAMKRPDFFVCLSNANKGILKLLGISKKNITLDEYWDLVITSIQSSKWYNEQVEFVLDHESEIFRYRAAMLDALYYNN